MVSSGIMEANLKYHPWTVERLTCIRDPDQEQCQRVSLTGAVSSQNVTEEFEGALSMVGNHAWSVRVEVRFTVRPTGRAVAKAGPSDPAVECGIAVAQRIKGTPGITG